MAKVSKTVSIPTTSTDVVIDFTEPYLYLNITNLDGTNKVWIKYMDTAVAVAEADDNIAVRSGETIVLPNTKLVKVIAEVAACKVLFWGSVLG